MKYVKNESKGKILFVFLALILSFSLVVVGCGKDANNEGQANGNSESESSTTNEQSSSENESASEEVRVIQHAMETTEIKGTPERIVVLTNEGTEALLAMGVKPVGAVKSWTGDPWYPHIKDQMEGVEVVGLESEVNVEAIAALQPDLIIGNKMRQEEIYEQLKAIAPTVFAETLRGDWKENFKLYAKAINKEEEGNKVLSDFDNRIAELREKLGDKINTKVSVVRFMPGKVRIYYKDTFSGIIFDQIGLARPEAQNKNEFAAEITRERIPEMEGDILFYFTYETGDGEASKLEEEWINDPLFKNLNVVKNNKVYKVDDTIWNTAGGVLAANLLLDQLEQIMLK
jgi:iron complex transport system substrate-binding protein